MPTKQNLWPVGGLLSGALVWGLIWYPYRVLETAGIYGPTATLLTYGFAILAGIFMLPRVWRELPRAGGWAVLLVLSAGWANFGYVLAMLEGEVMRVLLLFYLAPLWTVLFSRWLLAERLNVYGYGVIALSLCGAVVMLWQPASGLPLPRVEAEWIGLTAGMGFALSNVVSRRAAHLSIEMKSFSVWAGTLLLTLPLLLWQGENGLPFSAIGGGSWLLLALLGVTICATSYAVQYGVSRVPANRAILLFLSELIVAALSSWWLADEAMDALQWLGAFLIISASLLSGKMYPAGEGRA
ncbi:MAG: DMT family transporter [Gallionella sp.]|nr:DMT family transporter [Gallionella sp.]